MSEPHRSLRTEVDPFGHHWPMATPGPGPDPEATAAAEAQFDKMLATP
jgi:hypothetical protein|tara:strand:+ start:1303 stop:1446 length:144 start_codon:yes stop_codon:yes gene_type:complete